MSALPAGGNAYRKAEQVIRQGDLCLAVTVQLRTEKDASGPGTEEVANFPIPHLGPFTDERIKIGERVYVIRSWTSWVAVLSQSCEFINRDPNDSRVHIAPVVFEPSWPGPTRWATIRDGSAAGFLYLPAFGQADEGRCGRIPGGWPNVDAAIVISGMTLGSIRALAQARFSLTTGMQHSLQKQIVTYFSVRDWKAEKQSDELRGKRIAEISRTSERVGGPAALYKVTLEDDAAGDEATVVYMAFQR